jgi:Zn finger protein HypA/HybF involved in hydrogenase expression
MKYKCKECGTEFEARFDVVCPKCGSTRNDIIYTYHYPKKTAASEPVHK